MPERNSNPDLFVAGAVLHEFESRSGLSRYYLSGAKNCEFHTLQSKFTTYYYLWTMLRSFLVLALT